jgi:Icc-related predicted phosphoesterase
MKLALISDTHSQLDKVKLPDADILLHAGDATYRGDIRELAKFNEDLGKIKDKYKHGIFFTPGNHDGLFEENLSFAKKLITNATVLVDESITIEGKVFYFSPYQPEFCDWYFNLPRGAALKAKWDLIPNSTDVLITHGPPKGILDLCPDGFRAGCEELWKRVIEVKPQIHLFGHIHFSYGMQLFDGITFVNASICTESYTPTNKPIVVELD